MESIYNCRVLFSFHTDPEYMHPPAVTADQIICGPLCKDIHAQDGSVKMIRTPCGSYDMRAVIQRIPPEQRPDLLIVKADATRSNLPTGIDSLGIPSILIIGDTHHMEQPLRTMMRYALTERYTYYVSDHKRHHLHYFIEAGLPNVHWIPGLLVRDWKLQFQEKRNAPLTFVGQAGKHHPWRKSILERLSASGRPLTMGTASQEQAAKIYATSALTLNFSLNGDLNLRVFEVLSAGGCLLTDRLSWQSGLELLFRDGEHLVLYDGYDDLCKKIDYLLSHPEEAIAIARSGYEAFNRSHHSDRKRRHLLEMVFNGWLDPQFEGTRDRRATIFPTSKASDFFTRLGQYEWLQDRHREGNCWRLLFSQNASPRLLCDLVDLPRFQIVAVDPSDSTLQIIELAEINPQIACIGSSDLTPELACICVCLTTSELTTPEGQSLIRIAQAEVIVITDWEMTNDAQQSEPYATSSSILHECLGFEPASDESIGIFEKRATNP